MPFIVRWPGHVAPASQSERVICFTDILATLSDVTGVALPEGAGPDSYSFLPELLGVLSEDQPTRPPLVLSSGNGTMVIRSGEWKLIEGLGSGGFSKPEHVEPGPGDPAGQLYNLDEDPGETNNLYSQRPEIVIRLQSEMKQLVE
jgi:arylsulfatase A-like enzyme